MKTVAHPINSTHVSVRFVCVYMCVRGGVGVEMDNKLMGIAIPLIDLRK
jgi:hypothetical protein